MLSAADGLNYFGLLSKKKTKRLKQRKRIKGKVLEF